MKKQYLFITVILFVISTVAFSQNNDSLREKYRPHHPQDVKFRFNNFKVDKDQAKKLSFNISGYVKAMGTADFGNVQNTNEFITSMIPIYPNAKEKGPRSYLDVRQSRIAFEGFYKTDENKKIRIYIETDFYSSEENQYLGGYGLHLRHAYAEYDNWLVGQYWSTAFNIDATPNQVDLEGPNSILAPRNPQLRYTLTKEKWAFAAAIENNFGDYTPFDGVDDNIDFQLTPDVIVYFESHGDWGNARLTGLVRNIAFVDSTNTNVESVLGWGVNFSGYVNVANRKNISDAVMWGVTYGTGISYYVDDIMGAGWDAMPDSTGVMMSMPSVSAYVAYKHAWNERLESNIMAGYVQIDNKKIADDNMFDNSVYATVNLMASPFDRLDLGIEFMYGKNVNKIQDFGEAYRAQIMGVFNF